MHLQNNLTKERAGRNVNKILVVGSLNMDFVIDVKNMPLAGETILGEKVTLVPGGKGANQAYAAGKLGGNVRMIGAVGNDMYGSMLKENLESVGVDTSGIETIKGAPTGNAFITVDECGENSIIVIQGTNACLTKEMIDRHMELIDQCDTVIMQLEIPLEIVTYVKNIAKEKGKTVILDPAPAKAGLPDEFFRGFDIVKPNETEIQTLSGRKMETKRKLEEGAKQLLEKGVDTVIITLGGDGALLVTKDASEEFHAKRVNAVDTTAAGDSFTAALAVALGKGMPYSKAIEFGNSVSGIVVTRKGAQTSIPTMEEAIKNMKERNENENTNHN